MTSLRVRGDRFHALLAGATARAGAWALLGQVVSAVASTASFIMLARLFGPSLYGSIAGALALVLTVGLLAAFGASALVVRDIASGRFPPATALSAAIAVVCAGAAAACLALLLLHPVVLPQVPLDLLMTLAVAELLGNAVTGCCIASFFAVGWARAAGVTVSVMGSAKLLAVGSLALTGNEDPQTWANLYAAFTTTTALLAITIAFRRYGRPVLCGHRILSRAREGVPFSFNLSANAAQNDADKILLVRFGFSQEAGLYTAAYRLVGLALMPILALLQVTYPRYFALGERGGLPATAVFSRRLLRPLAVYALVSGLLLALCAPLLPLLLGRDYQGAVPVLVALSPLVLLKVLQYVPAEALTGAGFQTARAKCMALSSSLNVLLCLLFIPRYGLLAALIATFAAEVAFVALCLITVRRKMRATGAVARSPAGACSTSADR